MTSYCLIMYLICMWRNRAVNKFIHTYILISLHMYKHLNLSVSSMFEYLEVIILRYIFLIRRYCSNCEISRPWWRHEIETFSALLAICAANSPVPGEFPTQRPVTRNFYVLFDLRPNKLLTKQSWGWSFETPSHPLCRHRNGSLGVGSAG